MGDMHMTSDPKQLLLKTLEQYNCMPVGVAQRNQNLCDFVLEFETVVIITAKLLSIISFQSKRSHYLPHSHRNILEVTQCLVKSEHKDAYTLPTSVAARHRLGAELAQLIKEIGYTGECGYNHFLYPNEKETFELFSWLVGQVNPSAESYGSDATNQENTLERTAPGHKMLTSLGLQFSKQEMPEEGFLSGNSIKICLQSWKKQKTFYAWPNTQIPALHGYQKLASRTGFLPRTSWHKGTICSKIFDQDGAPPDLFDGLPLEACRITSLSETLMLNTNSSGPLENVLLSENLISYGSDEEIMSCIEAHSSSHDTMSSDHDPKEEVSDEKVFFTDTIQDFKSIDVDHPSLSATQEHVPRDCSLVVCGLEVDPAQTMMDRMRLAQSQSNSMEEVGDTLQEEEKQIEIIKERIAEIQRSGHTLQREVSQYRKLVKMIVDPESNIGSLKVLRDRTESQLFTFTKEWEQHQERLSEKETVLEIKRQDHQRDHNHLIMCLKRVRRELKQAKLVLQEKTKALQEVEDIYQHFPKTKLTRKGYINGILEVIKQIHKQKQEILNIIQDIRSVQKQLNLQAEKLKRVETMGDEKLFRVALTSLDSAQPNPFTSATTSSTVVSLLFPSASSDKPSIELGNKSLLIENYRKFTEIRQSYEELFCLIDRIGKAEDGSRGLRNWVSQAESRDSGRFLQHITNDIASIRKENEELLRTCCESPVL